MGARSAILAIQPALFVADRLTKALIESRVSAWESLEVIPHFFSIVHTQNRGAAFSLLADSDGPMRAFLLIGFAALVSVLVAWMLAQSLRAGSTQTQMLRIGLALVLGGAAGNLFDRVAKGSVTDFLLFYIGPYQWPAFNLADSAISVGAGLILLDMWRTRHVQART